MIPVPVGVRKFHGSAMLDTLEGLLGFLSYATLYASTGPWPGSVTVARRGGIPEAVRPSSDWAESRKVVTKAVPRARSRVEDTTGDSLCVALHDSQLGSPTLFRSKRQFGIEEAFYTAYPEAMVASMICCPAEGESLLDTEVVIVAGATRCSHTSGRFESFIWTGDAAARELPELQGASLACMDPSPYPPGDPPRRQYRPEILCREANKAFKAFGAYAGEAGSSGGGSVGGSGGTVGGVGGVVSTGEWGTGLLGGDPELKALIQWLAASEAGHTLEYHSFGVEDDQRGLYLQLLSEAASDSGVMVGQVWGWLVQWGRHIPMKGDALKSPIKDMFPPGSPFHRTEKEYVAPTSSAVPRGILVHLMDLIPGGDQKLAESRPQEGGMDRSAEQRLLQAKLTTAAKLHLEVEEKERSVEAQVSEIQENIRVLKEVKEDSKRKLAEEESQEAILEARNRFYKQAYDEGRGRLKKAEKDVERMISTRAEAAGELREREQELKALKKRLQTQELVHQDFKNKYRATEAVLARAIELTQGKQRKASEAQRAWDNKPETVSKLEVGQLMKDMKFSHQSAQEALKEQTEAISTPFQAHSPPPPLTV